VSKDHLVANVPATVPVFSENIDDNDEEDAANSRFYARRSWDLVQPKKSFEVYRGVETKSIRYIKPTSPARMVSIRSNKDSDLAIGTHDIKRSNAIKQRHGARPATFDGTVDEGFVFVEHAGGESQSGSDHCSSQREPEPESRTPSPEAKHSFRGGFTRPFSSSHQQSDPYYPNRLNAAWDRSLQASTTHGRGKDGKKLVKRSSRTPSSPFDFFEPRERSEPSQSGHKSRFWAAVKKRFA
jgi:hypothetical protein